MTDAILYFKRSPGLPNPVTVTSSPFVYANATSSMQVVNVSGGVVSLIEIDAGLGYLLAVGIAGVFTLMPNQSMRVTYVVSAPTMTTVTL